MVVKKFYQKHYANGEGIKHAPAYALKMFVGGLMTAATIAAGGVEGCQEVDRGYHSVVEPAGKEFANGLQRTYQTANNGLEGFLKKQEKLEEGKKRQPDFFQKKKP